MPRRKRDGSWKPPMQRWRKTKARVRIDGVDHYLGTFGTPQAEAKYNRLIASWLAGQPTRPLPRAADSPTVAELLDGFLAHAEGYYRKNGKPTAEHWCYRTALAPVVTLYADLPAADFGPAELQAVRREFLRQKDARTGRPWSRGYVNEQVNRVRRVWSWGVGQGVVPAATADALRHVRGLRKTKSTAPEGRKVRPVRWEDVERTLPLLRPALAALVRFHRLVGCRAEEACAVRPCDIDRAADPVDGLWRWAPCTYKTEHHDTPPSEYWLAADAQAVLLPWLEKCPRPDAWAFPSRPRSDSGGRYTKDSYNLAVRRAIKRHNAKPGVEPIRPWSAGRVRHLRLTEVREYAHAAGRHGGEAAQAVAGHQQMSTSERYTQLRELARRTVRDMARG